MFDRQLDRLWTTSGGPNAFDTPDGLALDAQGNLYVMDSGNNRVQKFDARGRFITMWGAKGEGEGQFDCTQGLSEGDFSRSICMIAVDRRGDVYVTDRGNARVQKFDSNGEFVAQWGGFGSRPGDFDHPFGITVDRHGNVYVGDVGNGRIQKFDGTGAFLAEWGSRGNAEGQFSADLADLVVDDAGNVYVTDRANGLQKFDSNGAFVARIQLCGYGGAIHPATGIALNSDGNLYVFDMAAFRLCEHHPDGRFITAWSGEGGTFPYVGGIAVAPTGEIYVAELFVGRVSAYRQP